MKLLAVIALVVLLAGLLAIGLRTLSRVIDRADREERDFLDSEDVP